MTFVALYFATLVLLGACLEVWTFLRSRPKDSVDEWHAFLDAIEDAVWVPESQEVIDARYRRFWS